MLGSEILAGTMDPEQTAMVVAMLLLALKTSIGNFDDAVRQYGLAGWSENTTVPPCQWGGISCFDDGSLSKVELPGLGLQGEYRT